MAKKPASLSINLLPKKEPDFSEKFFDWSLTFGRYIIIVTEIIVLLAFFSRFKLDRELIDLNDAVREKQKILETLKPVENTVNRLQKRLSEIKKIDESQSIAILALPYIASYTPGKITYKDVGVAGSKLTIVGLTQETADISVFVAQLVASNLFKQESVVLEKVERTSEDQNSITFTISAIVEK